MNPNFKYIKRDLEAQIEKSLNRGKVLTIYGARQTGKTTLLKNFFTKRNLPFLYLSCDETRIREQLVPDSLALAKLISGPKNIIIDEAQRLPDPGLVLKVLIDNFPKLNVIASGSSSFDLANKISEPLTGRHFQLQLYPLSYNEIKNAVPSTDFPSIWQDTLIFGNYPGIVTLKNRQDKINHLQILVDDYLYRDILAFNLVKNNQKIRELLVALGLQLGSEVSYHELAGTLSLDRKTVEHYIFLLEKCFVLFRLFPMSRNLRSEINRKVKIYFYDLGVRNALINNFNGLSLRTDSGAIFENQAIVERLKFLGRIQRRPNIYFWRTYDQKEIDYLEEINGKITGAEFKINPKKATSPSTKKTFQKNYPGGKIITVSPNTLEEFLT